MARGGFTSLDWLLHQRSLRLWGRLARAAGTAELSGLRRQRSQARMLAARLAEVIRTADSRLALPRIGSSTFARPDGTDWAWRPLLWRGPLGEPGLAGVANRTPLGDEVTIFHDCPLNQIALRQTRNRTEGELAPFALSIEVFRFQGSFLSLVMDLPPEACVGLSRRHLIRVEPSLVVERPIEVFLRLNIQHGPNTEQIALQLPMDGPEMAVEFDLAYTDLNEKRIEKAWLDLILEGPAMNRVLVNDLTLARYPRAPM
jgi:hypothetical protein